MDDGGDVVSDAVQFLKKSGARLNGVMTLFDCADQIEVGNPLTAAQRIGIEGAVVKSHLTALHILEKAKTWTSKGNQETAKALQRYYEIWAAQNLAKLDTLAGSKKSDTPTTEQEELLEAFLQKGTLKIDDQIVVKDGKIESGGFDLVATRKSPYQFTRGLFNDGESLAIIGKMCANVITQLGLKFDVICAPDPHRSSFAVATMLQLYEQKQNSSYACCHVTFDDKYKVTYENFEGDVKGKTVILVEDESLLQGVAVITMLNLIKKMGGIPLLVLTPYN
jgi:orotate phosphoribosyltransferase